MMADWANDDANLLGWRAGTAETAFEKSPQYDGEIDEQESKGCFNAHVYIACLVIRNLMQRLYIPKVQYYTCSWFIAPPPGGCSYGFPQF